MGAYFIFPKNITTAQKQEVEEKLQSLGYRNSLKGVGKAKAIGVCSYISRQDDIKSFTYLDKDMASEDPHESWTMWRDECKTVEEFFDYLDNAEKSGTEVAEEEA